MYDAIQITSQCPDEELETILFHKEREAMERIQFEFRDVSIGEMFYAHGQTYVKIDSGTARIILERRLGDPIAFGTTEKVTGKEY